MANFDDWLIQPAKHGGIGYRELWNPGQLVPCWDEMYGNVTEFDSRSGHPYCYVPDELKCKWFDTNDEDFNMARLERYSEHVAHKRPILELDELTHFTKCQLKVQQKEKSRAEQVLAAKHLTFAHYCYLHIKLSANSAPNLMIIDSSTR